MIARGMEPRGAQGKFGPIEDAHVHEPTPGPNTGDVQCRTCGVPLQRYDMDLKRGYGGVAAAVIDRYENGATYAAPEREPNRKERRAAAAKARAGRGLK